MQFKVPQDVQRKDTIIWTLTIQQLIICGVGGGIAYALYIQLSKTYFIEVWLPPVIIISAITLAFAFIKIHSLPFDEFLMHFIEYHILPRQRYWIQGTGTPFIPPFDDSNKKVEKIEVKKENKQKKSLAELTQVLDTGGETETKTPELSTQEKKEGLKELINQNYQATKSPII
ncbi:PrgI family protein [Candidatus Peregrinibacteria bacterium]|nr:PrgI family protein [Candidatus Peregrinibacteria bacterium]